MVESEISHCAFDLLRLDSLQINSSLGCKNKPANTQVTSAGINNNVMRKYAFRMGSDGNVGGSVCVFIG